MVVHKGKGKGKGARTKPKGGGKYTVKGGKVTVKSEKQRKFLMVNKIPMSHVKKSKKTGKKYVKRHNT
jgi:hypothetical protein